ncbi:MAG: 4a-hydroxytetrahydrobiopterin dehydratase [Xanthomonadales bacterium]|nr:4a-hydroxytetrahydrobiopterin dehydratase [Xanthomonadales bacterium]
MNSENELKERRCKPCEGGVDPLDRSRSEALISQLEGWTLSEDAKSIHRRYAFEDFYRTMAFVNALAWIANREDHHPDFKTGYNYCEVLFTTHAVNGLSENDFICAAKVNALLKG